MFSPWCIRASRRSPQLSGRASPSCAWCWPWRWTQRPSSGLWSHDPFLKTITFYTLLFRHRDWDKSGLGITELEQKKEIAHHPSHNTSNTLYKQHKCLWTLWFCKMFHWFTSSVYMCGSCFEFGAGLSDSCWKRKQFIPTIIIKTTQATILRFKLICYKRFKSY